MLAQLIISNFAIINHLETNFKPGLNVISGETGAGKSIIINAVNLILGGRASADLIRTGAKEARVEANFDVPDNPDLEALLGDLGIPYNGELLIKRTISRPGRNKITINGSMATLQMLARIGLTLMSISGQHEHQLLLRQENHLYLLDDFGGLTDERLKLNNSFNTLSSLKEQRRRREKEIKESESKQELVNFQIREIEQAQIKDKEDDLLEEERMRLQHAEKLMQIVGESYQSIYEREGAMLANLSNCLKLLDEGAEMDRRLSGVRDALASVKIELEEAAFALRDYQKNIVIDPQRLEAVEERRHLLNRLKKKYGTTLKAVLGFKEDLSKESHDIDEKKRELERTNATTEKLEKETISQALKLSTKRKAVAKRLEENLRGELGFLDMVGTRFEVQFYEDASEKGDQPEKAMKNLNADGLDRVEFMLSPNIGEDLRPLSKIASGGELSRIMLALKTILAKTASIETVVFDEVDAGIGGATAEVVGDKLQALAQFHQILCITHLPQIASKGLSHFLVKKEVVEGRTQAAISELGEDERIKEVARLLGGKVITEQAIAHAREMLN